MKTLALGLLALTATAAPAAAQVAPAYASYNKTDAILGGKPSALAAIMAQQSGKPAPQFAPAPQLAAAPSPDGRGALVRPAIYPVTYAPVPTDRPDVFGSVALPVATTSLDARWRKVAAGSAGGAAIRYAVSLSDQPVLDRIDSVNRYVNRLIRFTNDSAQYGMSDRWMSGGDTLRIGKGDCEDYAIAKLQMLRQAGFASKDLYLVILRDLTRNADHAVLVVRAEGRLLVLDNGNNRIVDSATIADYRPILTFSGKQAWTHGYRRATPPVVLASAERPAGNPVVQMASADRAIEPAGLAN